MIKVFQRCLLFSLAIAIQSCSNKKDKIAPGAKPPAPPPPRVEAWVAKAGALSEKIELPGSVIANESTDIHPEISGRITSLNINEGRIVNAGALLAKIYDGDLVARLNKLKVQLKMAEKTEERYAALIKINGISQQEYELSKLEVNNIKADIQVVESDIRRTEIRAPFRGMIGLKQVSPGAYVTPATVLTSLKQTDKLKIDLTLPEKYSEKVKLGQLIDFSVEGKPKKYVAKVDAFESGISEESRSLTVRAIVTETATGLLPGDFIKAYPRFKPDTNAILVPSQAIIPQSRGKKLAILQNGVVNFVSIESGVRDSSMVQILSGLQIGDTVILTGLMGLKPGATVNVSAIKN